MPQTPTASVKEALQPPPVPESAEPFTAARESRDRTLDLANANEALQASIDALSQTKSLDQIVPLVLQIVARTFGAQSCAVYKNEPSGRVHLRFWFVDGKTLLPDELLQLDREKFGLVPRLAEGFEVPDAYLGRPPAQMIGPVVINHVSGTTVPAFDEFAVANGWDLELNIGVGAQGVRAYTLCIYRGDADPFTDSEIALGEALAKQIGLAMETSRLGGEAREAAIAMERAEAAQQQIALLQRSNDALRRSVERVSQSGRFESLLEGLLLESMQVIGAVGGAITLWHEGQYAGTQCVAEDGIVVPRQEWEAEPFFGEIAVVLSQDPDGFLQRLLAAPYTRESLAWARQHWPACANYHGKRGHVEIWNVPCVSKGSLIASLGLAFREVRDSSPVLLGTLTALAQQMALMLEMARLVKDSQEAADARGREAHARRISEFLVQTVTGLSSSADLSAALESVVTELARALGAAHISLFRHDAATRTLRLHLALIDGKLRWGPSGEQMPLWADAFPDDITPAWKIMCEKRGLFTPNMTPIPSEEFAWPGAFDYIRRYNLSDVAHIVLFAGDTPVGSIGLGFRGGRQLQPSDKPFIEAAAQHAAIAIRMLDLGEAAKQAAVARERENAAHQRLAELVKTTDALKQTLDVMAFEPDLNKVLGHVLAAITKQLNSPASALWLLQPASDKFNVHLVFQDGAVVNFREPNARAARSVWGRGGDLLLKRHIEERRPIVYQVDDLEHSHPASYAFFRRLGIHTLLGIPLLLSSQIVGSITVRFDKQRVLSAEELELAQAMAHQATMAIQLTALAKRAGEAALVEERIRFSREVHDTLAQGFTGILMQLGAASQVQGDSIKSIEPHLQAIGALSRSSLAEARRSVRALRSAQSLTQTVEELIETVSTQTKAGVSLRLEGTPIDLGMKVENELGRIIREALHNSVKHAMAEQISVSIDFQGERAIRIAVKDDGVGFDQTQAPAHDSFGLLGMQERARSIGASFTIISEKGRGTQIVVQHGHASRS